MILRSNTVQTIGLGAIAVGGCAIGIGMNQPILTSLAIATTTPAIVIQNERKKFDRQVVEIEKNHATLQFQCAEQQQEIVRLGRENLSLKSDLSKVKDKTANQETRQRIVQSKLDKVQHSIKVIQSDRASKKVTKIQPFIQKSPAQLNSTKPVSEVPVKEPCTYVYADGGNLRYACELLEIELDCNGLRIALSQDAVKTQFKYYAGVRSYGNFQQKKQLSELQKSNYEVLTFPILKRDDGSFKTVGDDVKLSIDMVREVKNGDRVILVSGDGDFIPAIATVKAIGAKVTIVAHPKMLNDDLKKLADDFISLEDIKYQIAKHRKLTIA